MHAKTPTEFLINIFMNRKVIQPKISNYEIKEILNELKNRGVIL